MAIPPGLPPVNPYAQANTTDNGTYKHPKCTEIQCETFENERYLTEVQLEHMIVYHGEGR
jgi:hypothetical protein